MNKQCNRNNERVEKERSRYYEKRKLIIIIYVNLKINIRESFHYAMLYSMTMKNCVNYQNKKKENHFLKEYLKMKMNWLLYLYTYSVELTDVTLDK